MEKIKTITNNVPKCLVKIKKDKAIIDLILEKFIKNNYKSFHFLTHYKANLVKTYIKNKYKKKGIATNFYFEKKPLELQVACRY